MVIPPTPPPPPPPPPPCQNAPSKPPPPCPQHAAIPYVPVPVQETGDPPQDVYLQTGTEQDEAQPSPAVGAEDGLSDDEKINHPVQETEPAMEASGISQGPVPGENGGQGEVLTHMDDGEE